MAYTSVSSKENRPSDKINRHTDRDMTTATEEKKDAVLATSKYFDALAEMVPAKYFIDSGKV